MKKLLTIFLSIISLTLMAQVPQGVGYQGVATDASGIELVNQAISIRASVLSGSATGTIEWEETHATTTDTFGLFTLTIGQGTNTTNGAQTSFADISWGTNTHFLKIEMDVTGGSNYSFMGTNQMMSVPYALYAESANISYDSISNLLSNDSTFITTVGGGIGGDGCDYSFPEGIEGQTIAWDLGANGSYQDYTVPAGKNLFITNVQSEYSYSFRIDGIVVIDQAYSTNTASNTMLKQPICVKSGQVVSFDGPGAGPHTFYGILTDATVDPISFQFDDPANPLGSYTVPSGKRLIVTNLWGTGACVFNIDGVAIASGQFNYPQTNWDSKYLEIPLIINSGSVFSGGCATSSFNGYLVDENYFAGCGGGGGSSSSTSSLDSTTIANMIANSGGNMVFGERISINMDCNNNTQGNPTNEYYASEDGFITGKVYLYGSNASVSIWVDSLSANSTLRGYFKNSNADNGSAYQSFNIPIKKGDYYYCTHSGNTSISDPVFMKLESGGGSSTTTSSNSVGDFSYPDGKDNMTPIIHDLSASTYTVPAGKNLYITSYKGMNSFDELQISSNTVFKGRGNYSNGQGAPVGLFELPIIVASSQIVDAPGNINGFLVDESITPVTFSLSGNYVNNITYTVPAGKILVVLNFYSAMNGGYGGFQANGIEQLMGIFNYYDNLSGCSPPCHTTCIKNPMFFDENTIISAQGWHDLQIINGYLMDK